MVGVENITNILASLSLCDTFRRSSSAYVTIFVDDLILTEDRILGLYFSTAMDSPSTAMAELY